MFALHYKTRRFFCRAAFLVACLAPTAGVLAWSAWMASSPHVEACRRQLQQRLRLEVTLSAVSHPRPNATILQGLQLADPRTHRRVAYIAHLEVSSNAGQHVLIATGSEVDIAALTDCSHLLEGAWRGDAAAVTLVSRVLVARKPEGEETLKTFSLRVGETPEAEEVECQFRRSGPEGGRPLRFHLTRAKTESADVQLELDASEEELPLALAAPWVPWLRHLGAKATFGGAAALRRGPHGWEGDLQGKLSGIDLQSAIANHLPHHIDGTAELRIERARLVSGRLAEISGRVDAGPGLVGPSLRRAAAEFLELDASPVALEADGLLPYRQLAFNFQLSPAGLVVQGCCSQAAPGAVLIDDRHMLLGQPRRQPQPVVSLIRALAHPGAAVPARRETAWLLEILPVDQDRTLDPATRSGLATPNHRPPSR